ncbi:hypothetical protein BJX99DRAFT_232515 [Aspergillus californicus]
MSSHDSGLGSLSKLPPELRLIIWDLIWVESKYEAQRHGNAFEHRQNSLAIIRASRTLNKEMTHYLYRNLNIEIDIRSEEWPLVAHVQISNPRISLRQTIRSGDDMQKTLDYLPYDLANTKINVYAPSLDENNRIRWRHHPSDSDLAGIIALWDKVNRLVDALSNAPSARSIILMLHPSQSQGWVLNKQARLSFRRHNRSPNCSTSDHELVFLPFFRLRKVQHMQVTLAPNNPEDDSMYLDWSFHRVALQHFFEHESTDPQLKVRVDIIFDIIPRFIAEINLYFLFALRLMDSDLAHLIYGSRSSNWRPKPQHRAVVEQKHGKVKWSWPEFILQMDEAGEALNPCN